MGAFSFMPVHIATLAGNKKIIECPECKGVGYFMKNWCIVDHYCEKCDGTGEIKIKKTKHDKEQSK